MRLLSVRVIVIIRSVRYEFMHNSSTEGGRKVAYGTNDGVYFSDLHDRSRPPVKVLPLSDVTQIDILEEYQLLIVLTGSSHNFNNLYLY